MLHIQNHPFKNLIEVINQFSTATQFFQWFAADELVVKIIFEELNPRIFKRVTEYYLQGHCILTGSCRFEISALYEGFYHSLVRTKDEVYELLANFRNFDIRFVAQIPLEKNYTRLSHYFYEGNYYGRAWTIFELPILFKMYENKILEKKVVLKM